MSDVSKDAGYSEIVLTVREWAQFKELVDILQPFLEATSINPGHNLPTVSLALPTVLALNRHLDQYSKNTKHLKFLFVALQTFLTRRFLEVFTNIGMSDKESIELGSIHPFGAPVHVLAAVLDPEFGFHCLVDATGDEVQKDTIRSKVKDKL